MTKEPLVIHSPLSQEVSSAGRTVSVDIYHLDDETSWVLEIVDEYNNSTLWDNRFDTDSEAILTAKESVLAKGIESFIGPADGKASDSWK